MMSLCNGLRILPFFAPWVNYAREDKLRFVLPMKKTIANLKPMIFLSRRVVYNKQIEPCNQP